MRNLLRPVLEELVVDRLLGLRGPEIEIARLRGSVLETMNSGMEHAYRMLEELRVSLFAQQLRTPMPVSVKRLERIWQSITRL